MPAIVQTEPARTAQQRSTPHRVAWRLTTPLIAGLGVDEWIRGRYRLQRVARWGAPRRTRVLAHRIDHMGAIRMPVFVEKHKCNCVWEI